MRTLATALALSIVLLTAGCGSADEPGSPAGTPTPSTTSAEQPAPSEDGERTLRGKVEEGVEAGCMILRAEGESYLLVGPEIETPDLEPGAEVEVTGRVTTSVASFCQQGKPFLVEDIRPG